MGGVETIAGGVSLFGTEDCHCARRLEWEIVTVRDVWNGKLLLYATFGVGNCYCTRSPVRRNAARSEPNAWRGAVTETFRGKTTDRVQRKQIEHEFGYSENKSNTVQNLDPTGYRWSSEGGGLQFERRPAFDRSRTSLRSILPVDCNTVVVFNSIVFLELPRMTIIRDSPSRLDSNTSRSNLKAVLLEAERPTEPHVLFSFYTAALRGVSPPLDSWYRLTQISKETVLGLQKIVFNTLKTGLGTFNRTELSFRKRQSRRRVSPGYLRNLRPRSVSR